MTFIVSYSRWNLHLPLQLITIKVLSLIPVRGKMCSMQFYMINFVSDVCQIIDFFIVQNAIGLITRNVKKTKDKKVWLSIQQIKQTLTGF